MTTKYKNRQNESGRNRKQPQSEEKIMDFQTRKTADDDAKEDKEEPKEVEIKAKVKQLAKRRKRNIASQRNETNGEIRQEQQAEDFNERSTTEKGERMNEDEEASQRVISEKKISAEPNRYDRRKKETSAEPNCDKNDEKKSAEPIEQDKEAKNSVMELAVEECSRTNTCLKGGRVMVSTDTSHKSTRIESAASESSSDQPSTAEYDDMEKQERMT